MPKYTIQDIFKLYGPEYIKKHKLSKEFPRMRTLPILSTKALKTLRLMDIAAVGM